MIKLSKKVLLCDSLLVFLNFANRHLPASLSTPGNTVLCFRAALPNFQRRLELRGTPLILFRGNSRATSHFDLFIRGNIAYAASAPAFRHSDKPISDSTATTFVEVDMHNVIIISSPLLALGLSALIGANFPAWKISTASSIQEALKQRRGSDKQSSTSVKPDLLLLEQSDLESFSIYQRGMSATEIPATIVIGVDSQTAIDLCRKCDVHGYVLKNDPISCIIGAIQALVSRHRYFPLTEKHTPLEPSSTFTDRQKELIDLLLQGYSNKEMAHSLNLSYGTVKNYMFVLMRQTSVRSRLELAMKLRESGYQIRSVAPAKSDGN